MNFQSMAEKMLASFKDSFATLNLFKITTTVIFAVLILLFFNIIKYAVRKSLKHTLKPQANFMLRKIIQYTGLAVTALFVMKSMGVDTNAILGAAGILSVVVGFAAQTSVSSFISGLFLLSEKPFTVGDAIQVDTTCGEVLSVDLLSVKLRTFDNLFVRIPNETILKSNVVTLTKYPIRRLDILVEVAYSENLARVREATLDVCARNTLILDEPAPYFRVDSFADSGINLIVNVWVDRNRLLDAKTAILMDIKSRFDAEKIEIPYDKLEIRLRDAL